MVITTICLIILALCPGIQMIVDDVSYLKEYSCLRGLVALDKHNMSPERIDQIHSAMIKVIEEHPPTYT